MEHNADVIGFRGDRDAGTKDTTGPQVLVVGVETQVAVEVIRQLTASGYDYDLVSEWQEGDESRVGTGPVIICLNPASSTQCLNLVKDLSSKQIPVIAAANAGQDVLLSNASNAGALATLSIPFQGKDLDEAIDTISYRSEIRKYHGSMSENAKMLELLTARELRIVQLASDGLPNKQIATTIGLSVKSIERIRRDAYRKLNVRSTAEMTRVFLLGSLYPRLSRLQAFQSTVPHI